MKRWPILLLAGLSGACSLGPKNLDPQASLPPAPGPQRFAPAEGAPQATSAEPLPTDWWREFQSPELDALVNEALAHATDIAVVDAALRQAREQARGVSGSTLPQVDGGYQAERARVSNTLSPPLADPNQKLYTLQTAQVTVSYTLDVFGGAQSRIRSARAAAEVQHQRLFAARTAVVANLVQAVIQRASLADQIAAAQDNITANRDILGYFLKRQQLGAVGASDVATEQTALATAEAALPGLVRAEAHQRVVISTLIGRSAGSSLPVLPSLASLALPQALPAIVPSDLLARRPDILAARAQLEGAGADVGTAIAARMPIISLSATAGGMSQRFSDMFAGGNPFWTLLGGIAQPLFHGGALKHQQHAAEAALDGAKAQYRGAVLQAFGEVADALSGLQTDATALDAAARASAAADRALGFVQRQLTLGDVGTLTVLNATGADAQARSLLVQAKAARLADTVALFQAAGGKTGE